MTDITSTVERLAANAPNWRKTSFGEKANMLRECLISLSEDCPELSISTVASNVLRAQKMQSGPLTESESKFFAFLLINFASAELNGLIEVMESLDRTGKPPKPNGQRIIDGPNAAVAYDVYPLSPRDRKGVMTPGANGLTGEIWTNGESDQVFPTAAREDEIGVTVVLGAGNYENLGFVDCLDRLFLHNEVVILKHHPLRSHLLPVYDKILSPLIRRGFFAAFVDTGIEDCKELIYHPLTKHIHLTGGGPTHDSIISGAPGGELRATFTTELGCVTPWIVVPTPATATGQEGWTKTSLTHHAKNLVFSGKINGSASCNAPKAVVLPREWEHKDFFIDQLKAAMAEIKCNPPYYPGHQQRFDKFVEEYGEAAEIITSPPNSFDGKGDGVKHALVHVRLGPGNQGGNRYGLDNEAFAPVFAIVELDCTEVDVGLEAEGETDGETDDKNAGAGEVDSKIGKRDKRGKVSREGDLMERFLRVAPTFCNEEIFGSLSCTILAPPAVPAGPLDQAIAELKYGNVSINAWSGVAGYSCPNASWGAYPGLYGGLGRSGSGDGVVMNRLLFDESKLLKSVVRAPFQSAVLQMTGDLPPAIIIEVLYEATRKLTLDQQLWAVTKHLAYRTYSALFCGWL